MKSMLTIILATAAVSAIAQTKISRTVNVRPGQTVNMRFDYPELIRIVSWDKNEISIEGEVTINAGENDSAFELEVDNEGNSIAISNQIRDIKRIPERVTAMIDGRKMTFRSKAEWNRYKEENGVKAKWVNNGVDMEIELTIKLPRNMDTRVHAVYGMVEVKDFVGPLRVEATYGGVDVSFAETGFGELVAETNYGNIFSNLDFKPDQKKSREEDFHLYLAASLGQGPPCRVESQYGNVYLRKAKK